MSQVSLDAEPEATSGRRHRLHGDRRLLLAVTLGFAVLALLATFRDGANDYIADARLENYWDSGGHLSRHQFLWDDHRGLGKVSPHFDPAVAAVGAALSSAGLSPMATERALHAVYLTIAGAGMVMVVRFFRRRVGAEHVLAGLVYMFGPHAAQSLLPSPLFLHYALAPWLLVAVAYGITRTCDRWRWAAVFTLCVIAAGTLNIPSLIYAGVPCLPVIGYLLLVDQRAGLRDVVAFAGRAAILVALASVATVMQLLGNAPYSVDEIFTTELPSTIGRTSSWSESWRGLGWWLSYLRRPDGLGRPEAAVYLTDPWAVAGSFALPAIAVTTIWWSRWRPRLVFAALLLCGLVLMVGLHPVDHPTPAGAALRWSFENVTSLRGLRSGYKAGAAYAMGVAALFSIGLVAAVRGGLLSGPVSRLKRVAGVAAVVIGVGGLVLAANPFWTGRLYTSVDRFEEVPSYWLEAMDAVNALPDDGRVLILPGSLRTRYRWGYVGDDLFDAFLDHPHLMRQAVSEGLPPTGSVLAAIDDRTAYDRYVEGSFAPLARRLGIRWVLLRNDLDWQHMGGVRPSSLDGLRADPDLRLVDTFGAAGENTAALDDEAAKARGETELPPVELYEVVDPIPTVHVVPLGPPLLVSGDGEGLVPLGAAGTLDRFPGFRFTASMDEEELTGALAFGSELVITDSNRRTTLEATTSHHEPSYTLRADEELERPALELFGLPGSETVATTGATGAISATALGNSLRGGQNWLRPANAFDGDPTTSWEAGAGDDPVGQQIRVDLDEPLSMDELTLRTSPLVHPDRHVTRATLLLSDGDPVPVDLTSGEATVTFPRTSVRWFAVRIDAVVGEGMNSVGFAEISAPGLDLQERIILPDDVFRAAGGDQPLTFALEHAPVSYQFDRRLRLGPQDEEVSLDRRFRVMGARELEPSAVVQVGRDTGDAALDDLFGGELGAVGSARVGRASNSWGGLAVDERLDTAWLAPAVPGHQLAVRFPKQPVSQVDIAVLTENPIFGPHSLPTTITVQAGSVQQTCKPRPGRIENTLGCRIVLPEAERADLRVTIDGVEPAEDERGDRPVAISEIRIFGPQGVITESASNPPLADRCITVGHLDATPIELRLDGTEAELLRGSPVPATPCGTVSLDTGWHEFSSAESARALINVLTLHDVRARETDPHARSTPTVEVVEADSAGTRFVVDAPGGTLVFGQSFAPGWVATIDGGREVPASDLDTMSAWELPGPGRHDVEVRYRPQTLYEFGLALLAAVAAWCVVTVVRRPAAVTASGVRSMRSNAPVDWHDPGRAIALAALAGGFCYVIGGFGAAVVACLAVAVARVAGGTAAIGSALTNGLVLTAATTIGTALPSDVTDIATFVTDRSAADEVGRLSAAVLVVLLLVGALGERRTRDLADRGRAARSVRWWRVDWRRRAVPLTAAAIAAAIVASTVGTRSMAVPVTVAAAMALAAIGALASVSRVRPG